MSEPSAAAIMALGLELRNPHRPRIERTVAETTHNLVDSVARVGNFLAGAAVLFLERRRRGGAVFHEWRWTKEGYT